MGCSAYVAHRRTAIARTDGKEDKPQDFIVKGTHSFTKDVCKEGSLAFNDCQYKLKNVPAELLGGAHFRGPRHHGPGDMLRIGGPPRSTAYILIATGNEEMARKAVLKLLSGEGWNHTEYPDMSTDSFNHPKYSTGFRVYHKQAKPSEQIVLNTKIELSIVMKPEKKGGGIGSAAKMIFVAGLYYPPVAIAGGITLIVDKNFDLTGNGKGSITAVLDDKADIVVKPVTGHLEKISADWAGMGVGVKNFAEKIREEGEKYRKNALILSMVCGNFPVLLNSCKMDLSLIKSSLEDVCSLYDGILRGFLNKADRIKTKIFEDAKNGKVDKDTVSEILKYALELKNIVPLYEPGNNEAKGSLPQDWMIWTPEERELWVVDRSSLTLPAHWGLKLYDAKANWLFSSVGGKLHKPMFWDDEYTESDKRLWINNKVKFAEKFVKNKPADWNDKSTRDKAEWIVKNGGSGWPLTADGHHITSIGIEFGGDIGGGAVGGGLCCGAYVSLTDHKKWSLYVGGDIDFGPNVGASASARIKINLAEPKKVGGFGVDFNVAGAAGIGFDAGLCANVSVEPDGDDKGKLVIQPCGCTIGLMLGDKLEISAGPTYCYVVTHSEEVVDIVLENLRAVTAEMSF